MKLPRGFRRVNGRIVTLHLPHKMKTGIVTTIILARTGLSKFGFFFVSLMTSDCLTSPAHSNSMLGDVTLVS